MKNKSLNYNFLFILFILLYFPSLKTKSKFLSISETLSKEFLNLEHFIISNGGYINQKMIPIEKSNTDRYIMARSKIKKDERLLFIPDKILINIYNNYDILNKCREVYGFEEETEFDCLVYFITIDKHNSSSFYKPYYDYLPSINLDDFIISLNPEEIKILQHSKIPKGLDSLYYFLNKSLIPAEQFLKKFSSKNKIDYQQILNEFKINFFLVGTRNFGQPGYFLDVNTLVPYLDLLNHSDKNNTDWIYDEKEKGYILIANRDIEINEEVTDSYGNLSNLDLYNIYGFVIPSNIYKQTFPIQIDDTWYSVSENKIKRNLDIMFRYFINSKNKNFEEAKEIIIKALNDEKKYYSSIKINRYSINVLIKERLDAINILIREVNNYDLSLIN